MRAAAADALTFIKREPPTESKSAPPGAARMRILHRRTPDEDLDFAEFVREVSPRLLRTAYLLNGNQHIAEDLVQEALERACRRWRRIAATEAPEAYVRRIVVNLANDRWRRVGRLRETDHAQVPDRPDPRDDYARLELREQLTEMLGTLPIRMRTIIVLRYLHDMDDAQIADMLGITPGAVRSQLSRGLAKLRGTMAVASEDGDDGAGSGTAGGPGSGERQARPGFRAPQALRIQATADLPLGGVR